MLVGVLAHGSFFSAPIPGKGIHWLHRLEWVFSAVLALVFLVTGVTKAFSYERATKSFLWAKDVPRALVRLMCVAEILRAVGLILPGVTGIYPWIDACCRCRARRAHACSGPISRAAP